MAEKATFFSLLLVCGLIFLFPCQSEALFEACTTDADCTDDGAFCQDGQSCVCKAAYYIINQAPNQTCAAKHGLDQICPTSPTETCLDTNAECRSDGQDTTCQCKTEYSNIGGQCVKACGELTDPDNGVVDVTNNTEGGIATYTCNDGFLINGNNSIDEFTRQCSNGVWSDQQPACSVIDCGFPVKTITNGQATVVNETTVNSTATVQCNLGYEIEADTVTCLTNGNWSSAICTLIDCGSAVNTITNGVATLVNETTVNSTATVECNLGYEIEADTVTCLTNGNWSSAICTTKDCGSPVDTITNGVATLVNVTTVNSTATVQCNLGYEIEADTVTCLANGSWSSAICTLIDCGSAVDTITNGVATLVNETKVNSTATVECNVGYETEADTVTCLANGNWSSAICTIIDCGSPVDTITNGVATVINETTVNSTATVQCNVGYETEADTVTCLAIGNWSSAICTIIDCGSPVNTITNGVATVGNDTTVNATANVQCNLGYETEADTVTCLVNGSWSSANCSLIDCGSPVDTIKNGIATVVIETTVNSTATVECNLGYETEAVTVTCLAIGIWSSAICTLIDCGTTVNTITNGVATVGNETTVNSTATVQCNLGYETEAVTVTCLANGNWSSAICTIIDCGSAVNTITNGIATVGNETTVNATATVQCNVGYETVIDTVICLANGSWSSAFCTLRDCGSTINTVTNGIATIDSTTKVNSTATVVCDIGYEINTNTITCQPDGIWSSAICLIKDCGDSVTTVSNGNAIVGNTTYESTATISCNQGFESDTTAITCTADGTWSTAVCTEQICPTLIDRNFFTVSVDDYTEGGTATYTCNTGYTVGATSVTTATRTCASGAWTGSEPNCTPVDCGANIDTITNGQATGITETTYQSTANVTCNNGYENPTPTTVTCQANRTWSFASCTSINCGSPFSTITNGQATLGISGTTYQATASVTCNNGYLNPTPTTVTCQANGAWSSASCTPISCGSSITTITNGQATEISGTTYQSTANVTCNNGYENPTPASVTCQASGAWSSASCTPINCGSPITTITNGQATPGISGTTYQATASVTCNNGYLNPTSTTVTCQANGAWSSASCSPVDCGSPISTITNGQATPGISGTTYQATASVTCNNGYLNPTSTTVTCQANGAWSSASCSPVDCGSPISTITNGQATPGISGTTYQATASVTCNNGYLNPTSATVTCQANGAWSSASCSPVDCGNTIDTITRGSATPTPGSTTYGSTATVTCDTGYENAASTTVVCLADGSWSTFVCTIKNCGPLSNPQNGEVSYSESTYLATATYTCNTGYIIDGTVSDRSATITCLSTGLWSNTVSCSIKADPLGASCPDPSSTNLSPGQLCSGTNAFCLRHTSTSQDYTCQCDTNHYDDNGNDEAGQCKPVSELRVQDITFTLVTTSSMRVSWSPPTDRANFVSGYLVEWRRKDNPNVGDTRQVSTDTYFDISTNVVSGTAYVVRVFSQNSVSYSGTVKTTSNAKEQALKPQKPGSITASSDLDAEDQWIYLVWTASSDTVYRYEVRLYESAGQTALATITTSSSSPNVSIYFSQMKNGHRYDVSIIAVSQLFDGTNFVRSDDRREEIKTDVQIPSAPSSVQCDGTKDNSVIIKWQASTTPNGDLVGYKIDTYRLGSSDVLKTENKTENVGTVEITFEIGGLSPGSNYYFTVSTINEKYLSPASRLIVNSCQTRASMADAPNDLVISNIKSRNFTVSWTRPTNTSGEHRGYVIQVRRLDDNACVKQLIIQCIGCTGTFDATTLDNMCESSRSTIEQLPTQTISSTSPIERMFTNLDPDTVYNVIVTAVNTEGRGNIANQTLHTEEEIPQKPKDVTISDIGATSCRITWNIDGPRPGDTTYTVIVDAVTPVIDNSTQLTGFDNRAQDLAGLQEYWNYTVTIRAETSKGQVDSDPNTFNTLAAAPGVVDNFIITPHPNNDYRKLRVSWKIPVLLERNSIINRFELHHNTSQDMSTGIVPFTRNADDNFMYTQTFNVTPETYYQFKVFAINTDGQNGTVTEEVVMAPPGVPVKDFETNQSVINESLFTSTQTSLNIIYDPTFFINDYAGDIVASGVVLCAVNECPENGIGDTMTKEQFETYPNWHQAQPNGYTKYRCTRPSWRQLNQSGRKRRQTATTEEFVIGNESCNDTTRNEYCNGPLNPGTSYIVHVVICTNGGCLISNEYGPFVTQAVPDDKDDNTAIIAVAVVVPLVVIIAAVVVVIVILRRRAGNKPTRMEPSKIESSLEDPATARIEKHRPIKLSEFEEKLAKLHKDSNLLFSAEYEDLRTIAPSHPQEAANREENRLKNRYINILPFDHSRVKLFSNGEEDSSDYINANYLPGYRSPREYIGCQGPIPGTIDDFWRMVWEQKVSIIVMLTLCKEGQKVKCEQYWPEEQGEPKQYGDVVVEVTSTSTIQTYVMRIFKITYAGQIRTIKHFHFLSWLDFQANVKHDIILDFITHVRSHVQPPDTVGPMIVHCSAGVGRTGTYICLDHLMQFIHDHDFDVNIDIFDMVMRLRDNRPLMVQTEQQYVFIHDCVKELMDRKRKQMENIYENQGFVSAGDENIYQNTEPQLYENVQMKTSF